MNFGSTDRATFETNDGLTFEFSLPTFAISFAEKPQDPDACANCDGFNVADISSDLKVHPVILCQILSTEASSAFARPQPFRIGAAS